MGLRESPLTPLSRSDVAPSAAGSVAVAATLSTSTNSSSSPPPVVATGRQFVEESVEWADEADEGAFGGAAGMGREALATQQCQTTTTPCQFSAALVLLIAANGRPCQRWEERGPAVEVGSHGQGGTQNGGEWCRQWASPAVWN